MKRTTGLCLTAAVLFSLSGRMADLRAADAPVKALPAHLAESGIPTEFEIAFVNQWLQTIAPDQGVNRSAPPWLENWVGTGLPFSFRYDGKEFLADAAAWQFHRGDARRESDTETQDWTWLHAKTGLKVTWHIKRYEDYPAVDTLLTFENTGGSDTAILEQIENLDLKLSQSDPAKGYTVHGVHGGRCHLDDLMPFTMHVPMHEKQPRPTIQLLSQDIGTLQFGKSVMKAPLAIGDRKFEHGLGTHSNSEIRVCSPTPIERFSAWVGVNNSKQTRRGAGSVVFSVGTEHGELFRTSVLRGGHQPARVDLATNGVKTLYLHVDDAGDGFHGDHADWADAAITLADGQVVYLDDVARAAADTRLGSTDLSSNNELPFFNIDTGQRRGVAVGLGWTASWEARFDRTGGELTTRAGAPVTRFRLHPGEQVRGPRVLLLFWNGERLHASNMMRRVLYDHYVPRLPDGRPHEPLVSVNTCFTYHGRGGFLTQASEATLLPLVAPFIEIGAEAFVVDAGYYPCTNWHDITKTKDFSNSPERYPRGFLPIAQPLAKAGVAFGFWFWAEAFGSMDDPRHREAFLDVVDSKVKTQGMTMYRQDMYFLPGPGQHDRVGLPEMKHIAGLYAMQDELHRRWPQVVREGCCGGGRRIDLETLSRFLWHQKSDSWFKTVSDQTGLGGVNLYLPGGVINVPTQATDNFGLWSSFAGQLCLAWHPLDKDFPMELAKKQVKLYKRVRPLLSGDFYPLTECTLDKPWLAYQFHRTDLNQGFALIFKRKAADGDVFIFAPKGLDPQSRYAIECQSSGIKAVHTGAEFSKGIPLTLQKTPDAEFVIYQQQP